MYLKRLEVLGFKSFAGKTALELEPGIVAIVGPNGSGKSNLADAIRWALGEQNPRAIRSRKSEEVIFAGSHGRKPTGMAQVSLVLDNTDGRVPLEFSEITITRRLYRSGDSEYLLNGSRVRLKDISDLLLGAGLGPDSYCVIGQGSIDDLVMQRPEERRILFDSAADIRRFQARLAETQLRLAQTQQNLLRCQDVIAELEPHVRRLKVQADRAERVQRAREELAHLSAIWYRHKLREARASSAAARAALERSRSALQRAEQELRSAETRVKEQGDRLAQVEEQLAEARTLAESIGQQRESVLRQLAVHRERLHQASRTIADIEEEHSRLVLRVREREDEAQRLRDALQAKEAELSAAAASHRRAQSEYQDAAATLASLREQSEGLRLELSRLEREDREVERRQAAQMERLGRLEQAVADRRATIVRLDARLGQLDRELEEIRAQRRAAEARLAEARVELEALSDATSRLQQEIKGTREARRDLLATVQLHQERLASMKREGDLFPSENGPSHLLMDRTAGIIGLLGAFVEVPAEHQPAIEAVLADLAHAVVTDPGSAARVAQEAHRAGVERTPIIETDAVAGDQQVRDPGRAARWVLAGLVQRLVPWGRSWSFKARARRVLAGVPMVGFADELVIPRPEVVKLVSRFLGRAVVVPDLETATRAAALLSRFGCWWVVATADGALIRADGVHVVGRRPANSVLSRSRSIHEIAARITSMESQLGQLEVDLATREATLSQHEIRMARIKEETTDLAGQVSSLGWRQQELEKQAETARAEVERLRTELEAAERERATLAPLPESDGGPVTLEQRRDSLAGRLEALKSLQAEAESVVEARRTAVTDLQTQVAVLGADVRNLRGMVERALRELEGLRSALSDNDRRRETARKHREQSEKETSRLSSLSGALEEQLAPLLDKIAALQGEQRALREEAKAADEELKRCTATARALQAQYQEAAYRAQRCTEDEERLRRELTQSAEELYGLQNDSWPVQLRLALEGEAVEPVPAADLDSVHRRMAALRREIRAAGAADTLALQEYRELSERHDFLRSQVKDLNETLAQLRRAEEELQAAMTTRFRETFHLVNEAFRDCFVSLFGGGDASLVLTQPDNLLASGVDIAARPPGKKLQGLMSLSGGERALTMVALYFALLKVNPSPFCVLDEVDAALDEANVLRFTRMLKEYSGTIQFLVVTHNRATMEAAGAIYGVTMEDSSVSRVLSVRLQDVADEAISYQQPVP